MWFFLHKLRFVFKLLNRSWAEAALQKSSYERCSENMQQNYRRTPVLKYDFNKVEMQLFEITFWHGCFPINLRHISRTLFHKISFGRLLVAGFELKYWRTIIWSLGEVLPYVVLLPGKRQISSHLKNGQC